MVVNPYDHVHKLYHVVKSKEFMDSGIGEFVCSLDRSKESLYTSSKNSTILFIQQLQSFVIMMATFNLPLKNAVIRIDHLTGNLEAYRVLEEDLITLRLLGIL